MKSGWLVLACLAAGPVAQGYQASAESATGSIEGQVLSASTGTPLKKALVRLVGAPQGRGQGMAMGPGQGAGVSAPGAVRGGGAQAAGQAPMGGRGGAAAGRGGQAPAPQPTTIQTPAGVDGGAIQMQVQAALAAAGMNRGGMPAARSAETDETGKFSFTGLPAGRYQLTAERQGHLRQSYGARKYNTSGVPIVLTEGQRLSSIVMKLNPQSVIVGKVLDEDGDPVQGLQVRAMRSVYRNGKKQWSMVAGGQTSDIGQYRIPGLEPGKYIVSTVARNTQRGGMGPMGGRGGALEPLPETAEMIYAATYFPNGLDVTTAVPVDLAPGSELSGIDIRLRKSPVYRVRGRVMNASATGRGQVMVNLVQTDGLSTTTAGTSARPPDYEFEFRGISPGSYTLVANSGGPGGRGGGGGQAALSATQRLDIGNRHVDGLVLSLAPGADVQGTVKIEGSNAAVATGGLSVALRSSLPAGQMPRARVAENLTFTLSGIGSTPYSVVVTGMPENCYVKSVRYGGQEVSEDGIQMSGGGTLEVILSATAGQISGTVVDKDGNPSAGATVALYPKDGPMSASRTATTNETGTASFRGLKPGEYRLMAWEDIPQGAYLDPDFVKPYEGRGESIKLGESGQQSVQVKVIPVSETDR